MKGVKLRCLFAATACHSGLFLASLSYLILGECDSRGTKGQGDSFAHGEVHVEDVDGLVRDHRQVVVHLDHLQRKRGKRTGACGRVQQDILEQNPDRCASAAVVRSSVRAYVYPD